VAWRVQDPGVAMVVCIGVLGAALPASAWMELI
jgi:hypothetical protein